jgi:hypothetical protein
MGVRVLLAGATETSLRTKIEAEVPWVELRMLAGEDERSAYSTRGKRMGNWRHLDCFRPGPDDQTNVGTQPSSYLGGGNLPPLWMKRKRLVIQRKLSA